MEEISDYTHEPIGTINFQINKKGYYAQPHPYGNLQLTKDAAEFLVPLFESQGWKTRISDNVPIGYVDLDRFRDLKLNFAAGDIRLWCYNLINVILPMDLSRATIKVNPDESYKDKIILVKTNRYCNKFLDWKKLKPYKKDIIMMGLEEEHTAFCESFFPVDYIKVKDALEAAEIIAGAKFIVANQCGIYSLAEMMKTPRIVCPPEYMMIKHPKTKQDILVPGPCNVIAQGGRCVLASTTAKFEAMIEELNGGETK
jgi:hypothetical protein